MSTILKKKISDYPIVFFSLLYFLIFICFLSSYFSSVHFLFTLKTSYASSFFCKVLFLVFLCMYLINPQSGKTVYYTLTSNFFLEKIYSASLKLKNFTINQPILSFYLAYIYLLLLILHWYMLLFVGIDYYVEFAYHCFNIIRLFLFPIFIYAFIGLHGPKIFNVIDVGTNLSSDELLKVLKNSSEFIEKIVKSHPIKTKVGGVLLGLVGATVGVGITHGTKVSSHIDRASHALVIKSLLDNLSSSQCLNNENCRDLAAETIRVFGKAAKASTSIALDDVVAMVEGNPTLTQEFEKILTRLPVDNAEAYREALKAKEYEISTILASSNSYQVEENLSDLPSTSQIVPLSKPTGPNSPLELVDFWSFFFNNYQ